MKQLGRRIERLEQRRVKIEADAAKAEEDAFGAEAARELGVLPSMLKAIGQAFAAKEHPHRQVVPGGLGADGRQGLGAENP